MNVGRGLSRISLACKNFWNFLREKIGDVALFYLGFTILFGTILILFDKRRSWPDQIPHWQRLYQIAHGHMLAQPSPNGDGTFGGYMGNGHYVPFSNTAVNTPFAYFPGLLGFGHVRLAAFSTLVICACLIAVAIRMSGIYELVFCGVSMLPIVFLSICWPGADAVTSAFSLLFVSCVLRMLQEKDAPFKFVPLLLLLSLTLGLIKVTCVVLVLLAWLLPLYSRHKDKKKMVVVALVATLCTAIVALIWVVLTSGISPSTNSAIDLARYTQVKKDIIRHPLLMIRSFLLSFVQPINLTGDQYDIERNMQLFAGTGPQTMLPASIMLPSLVACAILILLGIRKQVMTAKGRLLVLVVTVIFFALTAAGVLANQGFASPLGKGISGLQSRYYIPIYVPLILLAPSLGIAFDSKKALRVTKLFVVGLLVAGYSLLLLGHCLSFS